MQHSKWRKVTGPITISRIIKHKHGVATENPRVGVILEAFRKLSMDANNLVNQKHKQEKAVNCLSGGRDVFAVTATGYGLTSYSSAVWNCSDDQENSHRATVRYCSVTDLSILIF